MPENAGGKSDKASLPIFAASSSVAGRNAPTAFIAAALFPNTAQSNAAYFPVPPGSLYADGWDNAALSLPASPKV